MAVHACHVPDISLSSYVHNFQFAEYCMHVYPVRGNMYVTGSEFYYLEKKSCLVSK